MDKRRSILELSCEEAKVFLMKSESYFNFDLPGYLNFDSILMEVDKIINNQKNCFEKEYPSTHENVNYTLFNNKDGKYAWRPMQLIHPAIYVPLVNKITQSEHWNTIKDKFAEFSKNKKIKCYSLPVESLSGEKDNAEQVSQWWEAIEQRSVELALDFDYIFHADIENCYGSIYTHSIAWALHTKYEAKKKENRNNTKLIGVAIDKDIQGMSYGQTNGIPQGSKLMDFIAEMVLGYADLELSKKIKDTEIKDTEIKDYFILRYRDDFRIFVNKPQDGGRILKLLTEVLIDLGMKFNSSKTCSSDDVIRSSIKPDKLHWLEKPQTEKTLQKRLLVIHNHSKQFPNSGSLLVALSDFYEKIPNPRVKGENDSKPIRALISLLKRLLDRYKIRESAPQMISIVVDIALCSPKTYPVVFAILSKLIDSLDGDENKKLVCKKIGEKFQKIPNTGHMQAWLQRISIPLTKNIESKEPLCKLVDETEARLWNNDWIHEGELKICLDNPNIVNHDRKKNSPPIIPPDEFRLYRY